MKSYRILLYILLVSLFMSCVKKESQKEVLNLGVMSSMDYLPLAVAQREGYFDKVGLNIKIQKFYSANERDASFQSGNVDGVVIDYTGAILQRAGGVNLKMVSKCDAPFYIVAGKESGVDSLSQLKGKKVAVSQNTVIDYCVDMALLSVGLDAEDIAKIEINKIPVRFEMLRNGQIDVTGLPDPFALMSEGGGDKIISSNGELGFSITGIVFSQSAIDAKSEMISKMYEAYNLGVAYLADHRVDDIKDILISEFAFPENLVSKAILPSYTKAALPSDNDIQSVVDWLSARALIDGQSFDKKALFDDSFVKIENE